MRTLRPLIMLPCLLLLSAGCGSMPGNSTNSIVEPTQDVGQVVQATFQAMTAQPAVQPTATAIPATLSGTTGSLAGTLSYPADSLPRLGTGSQEVSLVAIPRWCRADCSPGATTTR